MIKILRQEIIPIKSQSDIVNVRRVVREWATEVKFGLTDQTKLITAASELARNTLEYGKGGEVRLEAVTEGIKDGLRLVFIDQGPGIEDLELALSPGYSSAHGLGLGLSGSKRLVSHFEIESTPGEGTMVTLTKWK